jgi:hypothetical protein
MNKRKEVALDFKLYLERYNGRIAAAAKRIQENWKNLTSSSLVIG